MKSENTYGVRFLWTIGMILALFLAGCDGTSSSSSANSTDTSSGTLTILGTVPQDGATGVNADAPVSVLFGGTIDAESVSSSTFFLLDESDGKVAGEHITNGKMVSFVPNASLQQSTTYTLVITASVLDINGAHLAQEKHIVFTTSAEASSSSSSSSNSSTSSEASSQQSSVSSSGTQSSISSESSSSAAPVNYAAAFGTNTVSIDTNDSELLNPVIGGLLGTELNIDALGWEGLATVNVDWAEVLNVLNGEIGADSVRSLLGNNASLGSLLNAISFVLETSGQYRAEGILNQIIATSGLPLDITLPLGDLISLPEGLSDLTVDQLLSAAEEGSTSISVLNLLTSIAGVANYTLSQPIELPLNLPVLEATAKIQLISPPKIVDTVEEGTVIYSAATRIFLDIKVSLADLGDLTAALGDINGAVTNSTLLNGLLDTLSGLLGGLGIGDIITLDSLLTGDEIVHLPLYIELGAAKAEVASISPASVIFNATTGLTKTFIGTYTEDFFTAETLDETKVMYADILDLSGIVQVAAKAYAYGSSGVETALTFNTADLPQVQSVQAPLGSDINTLLLTLIENIDFNIAVAGMSLDGINQGLLETNLGSTMLSQMLQPMVPMILDPLSELLGVYAGRADLTLEGPF